MHEAGLRDMSLFAEILTTEQYIREWPQRADARK
jgi:hypothetical protein